MLYQSPNLGGVQLYGIYAFAATLTQPVPATTGNMLNLGASYAGYGLYAGLSYVNQHPGQETIAGLPTALTLLSIGNFIGAPAYRVGIVNFQFNYSYPRAQDPVCEVSRCGARHGALAQHRRAGCDDPGYSHGYDRDRGFVAQRARGA